MGGALAGIVVADFTRVLAGPYATMLLGDMGAEVIKVERAGSGDDTRQWGPPFDPYGRATYFEAVNRNKAILALDLGSQVGRDEASALAARADVVIHNFPPRTARKFGLDYDSVRAVNPSVVHCAITGFGSGAGAEMPGYDLLVQAMGGLMSVTGPAAGQPTKVGVALVDVITGMHAAIGVLAALHHRAATGQGQSVEVNLLSSLLSALVNQASSYVAGSVVPGILGNAHPSITPYEVYQASDRPLVIAVGNDGQFAKLCEVLGEPALAAQEEFATNSARVTNRSALNARLAALLATESADYWWQQLTVAGVPCGPINTIDQAFALAESLGLDPVVDMDVAGQKRRQVANPITFSATPVEYRTAPEDLP